MINGIEYVDYDKISDDLCWLGNRFVMRMVVKLSHKNKDNERTHFHREYKYNSSSYPNTDLLTIRRSFDYYLSIDCLDYKGQSIIITTKDILLLRMQLSEAFKWFYDKTFVLKNNKIIILEKKKAIVVDGLLGGKYVSFEPIVYTDWDENQFKGVRITFGDKEIFTDIPVNVFAGFFYLVSELNMYEAAQNLINYIGHPDFGTNLYTFERSEFVGEKPIANVIKEREIKKKENNKSFFDKMRDLE